LVAEEWVNPPARLARYVRDDEMQQAFNFDYLCTPWDADALVTVINNTMTAFAQVGAPCTWVLSNHDVVRHASRFGLTETGRGPNGIGPTDPQPNPALGLRRARAATQLMLALPGSAYLYQGEELGLPEHTTLPDAVREDPTFTRSGGTELGRDGARIPLPWRADAPAFGFSPTGETWLPQPDDWRTLAVDVQADDPHSTLAFYRELLTWRKQLRLGEATAQVTVVKDGVIQVELTTPDGQKVRCFAAIDANFVLPAGWQVDIASAALERRKDCWLIPANTCVWARPQLHA
ncbi:MAG: alpha-amylase family glycosyl hydrolase, partial [Bowdeniella nasicola]|nr:alpha-amylase family glycosyl hydrolase [Bowdeniella nasicola]